MTVAARRERERQERRSAILDAADRVFLKKGFEQATMDEIAAEAELSKGTLYLYFRSKDDLFTAISSRRFEEMVDDFEVFASGEPTGLSALRAMMDRHARFMVEHEQHFRIAVGRLVSGSMFDCESPSFNTHRALVSRITEALVTAIERGKRDGTVRPRLDPVQTSSHLWGALIGIMITYLNSKEMMRHFPKKVRFENYVEEFIQLICGGLQPADGSFQP